MLLIEEVFFLSFVLVLIILFEGWSMNKAVSCLKKEGFVVTGTTDDAVYMSRGADHRVVLPSGSVRRGQPGHRK